MSTKRMYTDTPNQDLLKNAEKFLSSITHKDVEMVVVILQPSGAHVESSATNSRVLLAIEALADGARTRSICGCAGCLAATAKLETIYKLLTEKPH
jgi:hypothetical protein